MRNSARRALRGAAVCAAYAAGAYLSGALTLPPNTFASLRPPNALILAAAVLAPPARWWLYPLATIPGNPALFDRQVTWAHALGYTTANIVEVALGLAMIWLLRRRAPRFNRLADCAAFVAGAAGLAPAVSAAIGAATAYAQHPASGFWATWRTWMLGDALSLIVLVPPIVLCSRRGWWPRIARRGEAGLLVAGLLAVTVPALTGVVSDISRFPALAYAPLPFLVWAAVRLGVVEHALALAAVSGVVLGAALSRAGAFEGLSSSDAALSMQLLLLMMAVPLMFLAAIVDERRQGEARFMTLFRATPDIIVLTSLYEGRIIEVNESFERVSGFTRGQAIGRTVLELGLMPDQAARDALIARILADGRVRDYPVTTTVAEGDVRHAVLSIERMELDGEDVLITVRRDVTDQLRADEEKARIEVQLQ